MTVLDPVLHFLLTYKRKIVSLDQVMEGAERPRRPVLRVMDRLVGEGYLEEIKDNKIPPGYGEYGKKRRNPLWRKVEKKPLACRPAQPKRKKRNSRDKIWKVVRMKRRFTRSELEITCGGVSRRCIDTFTNLLVHHGYLRCTGRDGREKVFLLIKNPGPQRPFLKEREVKSCQKCG